MYYFPVLILILHAQISSVQLGWTCDCCKENGWECGENEYGAEICIRDQKTKDDQHVKPLLKNDDEQCSGTVCPGGCCPEKCWYCCPEWYCAETAYDCAKVNPLLKLLY